MNSRQFFYKFGKLFYKIESFYAEVAKEADVKPNLMWILYALDDGNPHSQKEISTTWDIPLTTINTIVVDLEKDGMAELVQVPGEKREKHIILTKKGMQFSNEILKRVYDIESKTFEKLDEKTRINDDIEFMLNTLKEMKEKN